MRFEKPHEYIKSEIKVEQALLQLKEELKAQHLELIANFGKA